MQQNQPHPQQQINPQQQMNPQQQINPQQHVSQQPPPQQLPQFSQFNPQHMLTPQILQQLQQNQQGAQVDLSQLSQLQQFMQQQQNGALKRLQPRQIKPHSIQPKQIGTPSGSVKQETDQKQTSAINVVDQLKQETEETKDDKKNQDSSGQFIVTQTARPPVSQQTTTAQKKPANSSPSTFRQLYQKFTKGKGKLDENIDDPDDKLECLSKIIQYQACKIRRLEERLKKIESILPDYGSFDTPPQSDKVDITTVPPEQSKKRKYEEIEKQKRTPTAYQNFMSDEIGRIKASNPEMPQKEAFRIAASNASEEF